MKKKVGLTPKPKRTMSDAERQTDYPILLDFYQRKEAQRKEAAKRPFTEKMAAVLRLREFGQKLENTRHANRAKRTAKQISIKIKTR